MTYLARTSKNICLEPYISRMSSRGCVWGTSVSSSNPSSSSYSAWGSPHPPTVVRAGRDTPPRTPSGEPGPCWSCPCRAETKDPSETSQWRELRWRQSGEDWGSGQCEGVADHDWCWGQCLRECLIFPRLSSVRSESPEWGAEREQSSSWDTV